MTAPKPLRVVRNESYLTPRRHLLEAQRLLWVLDEAVQNTDEPRTNGDLALLAVAHAVTAMAADALGEGRT